MSGKQFLAWTLALLSLMLVFGFQMTDSHEKAHEVICSYYYGDTVQTKIWFAFDEQIIHGETQCANITQSHFDSYTESQSMVEAFGYQLNSAVMAFLTAIWLLGTLYILKSDYE
jgi:hypothetical protein